MKLTVIEITSELGDIRETRRFEFEGVDLEEDLTGFDFCRWWHHFWLHYEGSQNGSAR